MSQLREHKTLQELDLSDDFLFKKVMEDKDVCKRLLEKILGVTIRKVETVIPQRMIEPDYISKGIRLDVYLADDSDTVYTVEMQKENEYNIPKRSRYYQGMIDLDQLEKGTSYSQLKRNIIIFICMFDYFKQGKHKYAFENRCIDDLSLSLDDETLKVILNTKGTQQDVDQEMLEFLQYVEKSEDCIANSAQGDLVKMVHHRVKTIKENKSQEVEYMKLLENYQKNWTAGHEEGWGSGHEAGYRDGMEAGRRDGMEAGRRDGMEAGRRDGMEAGRRDGMEVGRRDGMEAGRRDGLEEGRRDGLEEGQWMARQETAVKMREKGMDVSIISECTQLSIEEINNL